MVRGSVAIMAALPRVKGGVRGWEEAKHSTKRKDQLNKLNGSGKPK
jgi:hypothetical protein